MNVAVNIIVSWRLDVPLIAQEVRLVEKPKGFILSNKSIFLLRQKGGRLDTMLS